MKLYKWFSICSSHGIYDANCPTCNTGHWEFIPFWNISKFFYWLSPWMWRKWMNRGNVKERFKNIFTDREENKQNPFPNL